MRNLWYTTVEQTYQDTAIWQRGHVIDHNLFEWRTTGWNVAETIYCHLGERGRGGGKICVCWNLTHSPGHSFICSSLFQGPIKWNHTSGTWLMHIVSWVSQSWLCKPNPPLGHSCLLLSFSFRSELIRLERWQSPEYSQEQEETRANKEEWLDLSKADWTLNFQHRQKAAVEAEWSDFIPKWEEHTNWPECTRRGWGGWDCGSPFLWSGT